MLPAGWPAAVSAELFDGSRIRDPRFSSLEQAIHDWQALDADRRHAAFIMVDPRIPIGPSGAMLMRLDPADIKRVAAILGMA
jgi:hypothetical protein